MLHLFLIIQLEFIGPCSPVPLLQKDLNNTGNTVGVETISLLEDSQTPYLGNEQGLNSVFETPIGPAAIEIVSESEMRSYGWCYSVDGKVPEVYPDQYQITPATKKIQWFFGYAHFKGGQWIKQCAPAYEIKPAFLCQ